MEKNNLLKETINKSNDKLQQFKNQMSRLKKHTVTNDHVYNLTNNKKIKELKEQIRVYKANSKAYAIIEKQLNVHHDFKLIERLTTAFSAVVIVGLTAGLFLMSRPVITSANFDDQMQANIQAAFNYEVTNQNTQNGSISYHTPHQFQYLTSHGVNDVIKYKDNQVIMHYNNQYNVIGQDIETYYLLREENQIAGEEIFYKNFNFNQNNGFVQLVQMDEKYLLTVFVDGIKLSSIIDYQEAPYMTYSMILMGKTVKPFESMYVNKVQETEVANAKQGDVVHEATEDEIGAMMLAPDGEVVTETIEGELSTSENEYTIDFDFSTEKRDEFNQSSTESE